MSPANRRACSLLLLTALVGCTFFEVIPETEAGPYPANAEALIRTDVESTLIDPDSLAQFAITKGPYPCRFSTRGGWCVEYVYNAKNRFGGYVGRTKHSVLIINNQIDMHDIVPKTTAEILFD